jgi:hypothetical protein
MVAADGRNTDKARRPSRDCAHENRKQTLETRGLGQLGAGGALVGATESHWVKSKGPPLALSARRRRPWPSAEM